MIKSRAPAGLRAVDVIVVGAGHAGLAVSRCLTERGIEHIVFERGEVANAWRHERWDSLRLLTPNWQSRLPGYRYAGADRDGFMTAPEVVGFIDRYARKYGMPVQTHTNVSSVSAAAAGYRVVTDRGEWWCAAVVLASGACNWPAIPALRQELTPSIASLAPLGYRNADQLPPGGVLVVGASASGVQLADEIVRSGRDVWLAVGEHIRLPRMYRGRDIQRWMETLGVLDERYDAVDDIARARRVPSPQLVGSSDRRNLDLNHLRTSGVQLVGRLVGIVGGKAQFSGSLRNHCAMADLKMTRLLDRIDASVARAASTEGAIECGERPQPTHVDASPRLALDLASIRTVVWATGYRPDYRWLDVPVLDAKGRLRHNGGVIDAPGMYAMGLPFMRRRKSSFIHGAEDDARDLTTHLASHLDRRSSGSVSMTSPHAVRAP